MQVMRSRVVGYSDHVRINYRPVSRRLPLCVEAAIKNINTLSYGVNIMTTSHTKLK
jgi:hypothetical protein